MLIDLEGVDGPVRVLEGGGIVLYKFLASGAFRRAGRISVPDSASPVTTKGSIEDNPLVTEMLIDIARGSEFG